MEPGNTDIQFEPALSELVVQALHERLVDACTLNRDAVTLVQEGESIHLSHPEGRIYLLGLLRGWWSCALNLPHSIARRPRSSPRPTHVKKRQIYPVSSPAEPEAPTAEEKDDFEAYLDLLLPLAERLHIIDDAHRDPEQRTVTLYLEAMSSPQRISYAEASEFLASCIIDELEDDFHATSRSAS